MKRAIVIVATFVVLISFTYVWLLWLDKNDSSEKVDFSFDREPKFFSVLDGMPVATEAAQIPAVAAVMIDNFPSARPQFGLAMAKVVYEAPVEGGLTRFMAVFDRDTRVERLGPVRSARPYFLDWQAEYGQPLYMHSGGSPEALAIIKKNSWFDANEFWYGEYYWRAADSEPPHNLFTSSVLWDKLALRFSSSTVIWTGRRFDSNPPASSSPVSLISIKYRPDYRVSWKFDSARQVYERLLNNDLNTDATGVGLSAENIIIQYVKMRSLDEIDRKEIITIGSGSARVLRDGRIIYGQWQKDAASSRTIFFDLSGEEIKFKPGVTWIQIVPAEAVVAVES